MSYRYKHIIPTVIVLCVTPIAYLAVVKLFLNDLFHNSNDLFLFLLFNVPFWVVLMMITGMEVYRRTVINDASILPLYLLLPLVSAGMAVIGISITPVGPSLLSLAGLKSVITNVLLGGIVGLLIHRKPRLDL